MILRSRLLSAVLAVLFAGGAFTGLATAQGPVEDRCNVLLGSVPGACDPIADNQADDTFDTLGYSECAAFLIEGDASRGAGCSAVYALNEGLALAAEVQPCTALASAPDQAANCIADALQNHVCKRVTGANGVPPDCFVGPLLDPDALVCGAVDPDGADTAADCIGNAAGNGGPNADDAVCGAVDPDGADKASDCVGNAAGNGPDANVIVCGAVDPDGADTAADCVGNAAGNGPNPDETVCNAVDPDGADQAADCVANAAGGGAPNPDDLVCGVVDPDGADTAADCVANAAGGGAPNPDDLVCGVVDPDGADQAADCVANAAGDGPDAGPVIAQLAALIAPKVTAINADPIVPVGQPVTVTGSFSTVLSVAAPVSDALPLDDVTIDVSGIPGAVATVQNVGRTFTVAFTPTAPGPLTLSVTLTYVDPLKSLADTPLKPLTFGTGSVSVVADSAPVADAGDLQTVPKGATVHLDGTGSSDPDGDSLTYAWSQLAGPTVPLSGANTATASFTAPNVQSVTDLVFHLAVSDGALSDGDNVTVEVVPAAGSGTGTVTIGDGGMTLHVDANGFTAPVAGTASSSAITAILDARNGVGGIDNRKLAATLTGPQGLDLPLAFSATADSSPQGDAPTERAFEYDLDFPARLKEGSYQFAAAYDGSDPATHVFTVANAAPTLGVTAPVTQTFTAGHGAIATDPVSLSLDDANWGGFAGAATELEALTLSGVPSGLGLEVSSDGGTTWTPVVGPSHDLSGVSNGTGALALEVRLTSAQGTVADGPATVTAVLSDQAGAASSAVTLFSLTIRPANYGFLFGVDDGGDGIAFAPANPGNRTDSADDKVTVSFTGTFDADAVVVSIGDFVCSCGDSFHPYNADPAKNAKVTLYSNEDLSDADPVEAFVNSTGAAGFDLALPMGAHGTALYVVLEIYVPYGHKAGEYTGTVDIQATGDAS